MAVHAINHIILTVSDLDRSRKFYGDLLGFELHDVSPQYGNLAYFPVENGQVWLMTHAETPPGDRFSEFRIGLDHLAFSAPDKPFLDQLATKLIGAGIDTQGVERFHNRWYYVAFRDPDNIQLEYWLDETDDE